MPNFKYGARQFQIQAFFATASTAANSTAGAFEYQPAAAAAGVVDFAQEQIRSATLVFCASVAQANSTAAGGSVVVAASQFNSLGNSVASVNLYSQVVASQAALTPIDVSTKLSTWNLSVGDLIVLVVNTNTVGIPASFPNLVLSATIDTIGA